jgi:hypothetical protein
MRLACGSRHPQANESGSTSGPSTCMSLVEGAFGSASFFKGDFRHIDLSHMRWEGPLALDPYKHVEFAAIPHSCSVSLFLLQIVALRLSGLVGH